MNLQTLASDLENPHHFQTTEMEPFSVPLFAGELPAPKLLLCDWLEMNEFDL